MKEWIFEPAITQRRLQQFCQDICLAQDIRNALGPIFKTMDFSAVSPWFYDLFSLETGLNAYQQLEKILPKEDHGLSMLAVFLAGALHSQDTVYRKAAIPEEIFISTMACFTRFSEEYLQDYGCYGFSRGYWAYRQLAGNIFCIGTLEYEMTTFQTGHSGSVIQPGEPILSVHIPSKVTLSRENLTASYRSALIFFRRYFPGFSFRYFYCYTWLLAPVLRDILPENSRILNFQQDYTILFTNLEDTSYLERVFGQVPEDLTLLAENTSLQRKLKELALRGTPPGAAGGYIDVKTMA